MKTKRENLSIVFLSDENFAQHLCVALYSLLLNNSHHYCTIYIIDGGIKKQTKEKIENSLKNFINKSIQYIEFNTEYFNSLKTSETISQVTYCRIMLPNLLPDIEKVLYLDCDILIHGDIAELYHQGFDNKSIIAIQDRSDHYSHEFKEVYNIHDIKYCFNTGIMLMNLSKMRENKTVERMITFGSNNTLLQLCMDQDLFNVEFAYDRKEVSATWNAHQYFFIWSRNQFNDVSNEEFNQVRKNPTIIHFTGAKPRSSGYIHPFGKLYFEYLQKTEFKDFKVRFHLKTFLINISTFLFLKICSALPRKRYLNLKKILHTLNK